MKRAFSIGALSKVQVSPDGKALLLAYSARLMLLNMGNLSVIWQVDPGKYLADITFSKDSSQLVSTTMGGTVEIRDSATGAVTSTTLTQKEGIRLVSLSKSGALLALTDYTGTTTVWETASGKQVQKNNGQAYPSGITGLAISPDDSTLIIEGYDSTPKKQLQQWKVTDGSFKIGLVGLIPEMTAWRFSEDGKRIYGVNTQSLTANPATVLTAWDAFSGKQLKAFTQSGLIQYYQPSPDGKNVLIATKDFQLKLLDAESGTEVGSFTEHKNAIAGMTYTPDGKAIVSISRDGKLKVWDTFTRKVIVETDANMSFNFMPLDISAGAGKAAILGPTGKSVGIVDIFKWELIQQLGTGEEEYFAMAVSPRGDLAAARNAKNNILIWDTSSRKELYRIEAKTRSAIKKLKFSPDGKLLTSLSDGQVIIWDTTSGLKLKELAGYNDFDYSPDNSLIASDSTDYGLYITNIASGKKIAGMQAEYVNVIHFNPDGSLIAVGGQKVQRKESGLNNLVYLVDAKNQKRLGYEMGELPGLVADIAFSPDGSLLASSDWQGNVVIWSARDGQQLVYLEEAACPPARLDFNPEGTLLYVGGGDGTIGVVSTKGTAPASPAPAPVASANATIPELSAEAYRDPKGLMSVNLPVGWTISQNAELTVLASAPDSTATIILTTTNTLMPQLGDSFTTFINAYEQFFGRKFQGYKEISRSIDPQKGTGVVTKSVLAANVEFIFETYYTRDDAVIQSVNFLTIRQQAEAYVPLYQKIFTSLKFNKEVILKTNPYMEMDIFEDPAGKFSFKYPLGWLYQPMNSGDATGSIFIAPDALATIFWIAKPVKAGTPLTEIGVKSMIDVFLKGFATDARITGESKTAAGDLKIDFEAPSKNNKGVIIGSNLGDRASLVVVFYMADKEKETSSLVEALLGGYQKK